jgi:Dolichyl-phosphate-mannose-protein mannosyltransferase
MRPRRVPIALDPSTVVVGLSIAAFVVVASQQIRLPGLYYDELFQDTTSLAFVKGGLGSQVAWVPDTEISIAGHSLPLMSHAYIGAVKTVAFAPVAAAFGLTPGSVRFFTIAVAALALVAFAAFARCVFPRPFVAGVAVLLLATDPSYVFFSRVDLGPSVFMFLLNAVGLWQLAVWWRTGRTRALVLGAFAFGLGVYDKLTFAWIVLGVAVAALLVAYRGVLARFDRRRLAIGTGAFVLGALPVIVYNLSWPPRSLGPAFHGTLHVSGGTETGNFFERLYRRFETLVGLLDGRTIGELIAGAEWRSLLLPILALVSAAGILLLSLAPTLRGRFAPARFVVYMGTLILVAAALTPGGSFPHHVLLVYPLPHLAIAAFLVEVCVIARERLHRPGAWAVAGAVVAAVVAAVSVSSVTSGRILARLDTTGGVGNFSDAIYTLDRYLQRRNRTERFVAIDWGIFQPLVGLSQGHLRGRDLWQELNGPIGRARAHRRELTDPETSYVLHSSAETNFPRARQRFFAIVRDSGRRARLAHVVRSRQGRPVFEIYDVT